MATRNQRRIMKELEKHMHKRTQELLPKIPEDWDGLELRWWLADLWEEQTLSPKLRPEFRSRYKSYRNDRIVKNL